jgi:cysteine desulfurase
MSKDKPIYLDHNATTPMDPRVIEAMLPYFSEHFGNPSSVEHSYGATASTAVEVSREQVAKAIGAKAGEIVFTGSCTEADNLAIVGSVRSTKEAQRLVTTQIEHPAVLESFRQLEREGHHVIYLSVDEMGLIRLDELEHVLKMGAYLVSIMGANNEVGTLQPLVEVGKLCAAHGTLFHSDLAQMPSYFSLDMSKLGLDLASFSGHKIYGPKGVGALYVRRRRPRTHIEPLSWGGGQEKGVRNGTLNTPLIVAMGEAMALAAKECRKNAIAVTAVRDQLRNHLFDAIPGVQVNGHPVNRLPSNLSVSIDDIEPLALIRLLRDNIAFSASSACSTEDVKTSHVLLAMFGDTKRAERAFRISPGKKTNIEDMANTAEILMSGIVKLRAMSSSHGFTQKD